MGTPEEIDAERAAGLVKAFAETREKLSQLRTLRVLAGDIFWWDHVRVPNDIALPGNTALRVPAPLLLADLKKIFEMVGAWAPGFTLRAPEVLTLWFREWKLTPDGHLLLEMHPGPGVALAIDPRALLNGIIEGDIQLDWKAVLDWRNGVLHLAETEGLFPGLSKT